LIGRNAAGDSGATLGAEPLVRSTTMYQRILVPVDSSPTSNAGLAEAARLAKLTGARLRLVHVLDVMPFVMSAEGYSSMSSDVRQLMREAGERVLELGRRQIEASGVEFDTLLCDKAGRICDQIAEQAKLWPADVIVLGTHGRRGVGRMLLGSDAEQIVRIAPVPVLLVRERG
jgi:nucleotide-binding universal stress UspA family protein